MALTETLREAILEYRRRLALASAELRDEVVRYLDLTSPVQAFCFEFMDPEWQYVLVCRSPRAADLQIEGRALARWEARRAFDEVLDQELWKAPLPVPKHDFDFQVSEPDADLRVAAEGALQIALHNLAVWAMQPPIDRPETHTYFNGGHGGCLYFDHRGPAAQITVGGLIDYAFSDAQGNLDRRLTLPEPPVVSVPSPPVEPTYDVHGAYLVPRVRVGRLQKRTLGDLSAADQIHPGITVLRDTLAGTPARITHNGFIGLSTKDPSEAVAKLNLVAAALLRLGHGALVFREQDLAELHEPRDDRDHGWGGRYSGIERQHPGRGGYFPWAETWFRTTEFQSVLRQAEKIGQEPWAPYVRDFLEAHSHLQGNEAPQSLLFSWTIIERWVYDAWSSAHGGLKTGPRFAERMYWLAGKGTISEATLMEILQVRSVRNRVVHEKASASFEEANHALETVERLICPAGIRGPPKTRY